MGQYIFAGVCTKISVSTEDLARYQTPITVDEIAAAVLARPMDLSLFEKQDGDGQISWTLRDDLLDAELVPFLCAQFTMMPRGLSPVQRALLDKLSSRRGRDQILRLVEEEGGYTLHVIHHQETARAGRWQHRIAVDYEQIAYLMEGKALLECYTDLFHYLGQLLALQRATHPIAAATIWTLNG